MIQRRLFLGSAAIGLAQLVTGRTASAQQLGVKPRPLNWHCEVVKTLAHTNSRRNPVVTDVDIRPAGDIVAVVGDDHVICLYNVAAKEFTHHLNMHTDWVRASKFSPDGELLATAGNDRRLLITSMDDLKSPVIEKKHDAAILSVAWSNSGKKIATVGFDQKIRIYDSTSGDKIGEAGCACNDNHCVAFSDDDALVAAGGRNGVIKVWNNGTMNEVAKYKLHRQRVRSLCFTADKKILSVGDDQVVGLTDPMVTDQAIKMPRQGAKLFAAEIFGGRFFATGGSDNRVSVWRLGDMSSIGVLKGHTGTVSCLAAADGIFVSGSFDTTIRLWTPEIDTFVRVDNRSDAAESHQTRVPSGWQKSLK